MTSTAGYIGVHPRCMCTCGEVGCNSLRRGVKEKPHGSVMAYKDGCRCAECRRGHVARTSRRRARNNALTQQTATKLGQEWTSAELEIATRDGMTAREAALMLGRTMHAVKNVRFKCRHEPKWIELLGAPRVDDVLDEAGGR